MARAEQPHARVLLRHPLERREESELLHQIASRNTPTLGHRPAAEHADAVGAVHGRDLADRATAPVVGVPVLHVVAESRRDARRDSA